MHRFILLAACAGCGLVALVDARGLAQFKSRLNPKDPMAARQKELLLAKQQDLLLVKPYSTLEAARFGIFVALVNSERAKAKLPPLRVNPVLDKVAQAYAADLARLKKLTKVVNGKRLSDRLRAAGYNSKAHFESMAGKVSPEAAVRGWMERAIEREIILSPVLTEIGVGQAKSADGDAYYCVVFARPG